MDSSTLEHTGNFELEGLRGIKYASSSSTSDSGRYKWSLSSAWEGRSNNRGGDLHRGKDELEECEGGKSTIYGVDIVVGKDGRIIYRGRGLRVSGSEKEGVKGLRQKLPQV